MSFVSFLEAASPSSTGGFTSTILMMAALVAIFYFFLIRPQNKKQKETEKMLAALKKGDKVTTIGGIHGTVASVKEKTVVIRVDDNVKIEFTRSAVASVDNPQTEGEKKDKKEKKSKGEIADSAPADEKPSEEATYNRMNQEAAAMGGEEDGGAGEDDE